MSGDSNSICYLFYLYIKPLEDHVPQTAVISEQRSKSSHFMYFVMDGNDQIPKHTLVCFSILMAYTSRLSPQMTNTCLSDL